MSNAGHALPSVAERARSHPASRAGPAAHGRASQRPCATLRAAAMSRAASASAGGRVPWPCARGLSAARRGAARRPSPQSYFSPLAISFSCGLCVETETETETGTERPFAPRVSAARDAGGTGDARLRGRPRLLSAAEVLYGRGRAIAMLGLLCRSALLPPPRRVAMFRFRLVDRPLCRSDGSGFYKLVQAAAALPRSRGEARRAPLPDHFFSPPETETEAETETGRRFAPRVLEMKRATRDARLRRPGSCACSFSGGGTLS